MISSGTSSVPKEHDDFPRLLYSDWTCSLAYRHSQACRRRSQAGGWHSQTYLSPSQLLPGLLLGLPGMWLALADLLRGLPAAPRLVTSPPTCTQASGWRAQALPGAPDGHCIGSSKLWDLTTLGFWSNNSWTLPQAPSDKNTFC
jgi:hypothetical protein